MLVFAIPLLGSISVSAVELATATVAALASLITGDTLPKEDCDKGCPPCQTLSGKVVPVGTVGYRPLDIIPNNEMQHGIYGSHHNIFVANQNPNNCQCFWQKQKFVLKPDQLTSDMIPIEPFVN